VKRYGFSIVGAGRLGRSLAKSLRERGWKIHSVVTRSEASARRAVRAIGEGRPHCAVSSELFLAPIILIAVPDSAIDSVARHLADAGRQDVAGHVVLHTAGALSSEVLAPLRELGASIGSVHPLQSFSGVGVPSLDGRVFAIEGDARAVRVARALTRALGGQSLVLNPASKPLYHAAATMAAGQILAQLEAAIHVLASLGIKRRDATRALLPLTRQVLQNDERLGPRAAWTGPLARGDYQIVRAHEKALSTREPEFLAAYRALNRLAVRVLSGDPEHALAALDRVSQETINPLKAKGVTA
jgi:predicted short-subunit dehydrogenase-like oxidoreductase (DUF2520 family)